MLICGRPGSIYTCEYSSGELQQSGGRPALYELCAADLCRGRVSPTVAYDTRDPVIGTQLVAEGVGLFRRVVFRAVAFASGRLHEAARRVRQPRRRHCRLAGGPIKRALRILIESRPGTSGRDADGTRVTGHAGLKAVRDQAPADAERAVGAQERRVLPCPILRRSGVPGVTRTRDPQFRKLLLYPAELRGRGAVIAIVRACRHSAARRIARLNRHPLP
jgi:hypothetical protein